MPLPAIGADERTAALAAAKPDLAYIMEELEVDPEVQAAVYHAGFTNIRRFVGMEETKEGVRRVLRVEFGLDGADGLLQRGQVADLLSAWEAAKEQAQRENVLRADKKASQLPIPCPTQEHRAMKVAFERMHYRLLDEEVPGRHFVGQKLDQLAENDPVVEKLN